MLKNVLIGTNVSYTSAASPYLLAPGEIGIYSQAVDGTLTLLTTTPSAAQLNLPIIIAQGVPAGQNIRQFKIMPGQKKSYSNNAYVAPVPTVYNIGYDGTTYDLVSGAAGTYGFSAFNTTLGNPPFPFLSATPYFTSAGAATSSAIAQQVIAQFNNTSLNLSNQSMPQNVFAYAEMLSAATSVQLVTSAPANITGTVTNGSQTLILSGSTAGGTTAAVAGDFIRIGHATTTTLPVYKIQSISGTTVTLATPYVNTTLAIGASVATVALGYATAANVGAAAAGVRLTEFGFVFSGSTLMEAQVNKTMTVACSVNASGTPVQNNTTVARSYVTTTGAITSGVYTEGNGTYTQVAKKENTVAGYGGFIDRPFIPAPFSFFAVAGTNYQTLGVGYFAPAKDKTGIGYVGGEALNAILAVVTGASQITTLNTILAAY